MAGMAALFLQLFAQDTARLQGCWRSLVPQNLSNRRIGATNGKSLLDLNIARTRMHVQQDPAIPDFSLDVVAGHRALHGKRMIDLKRSGRGAGINVKRGLRWCVSSNVSGAGAQPPIGSRRTFSLDIAAAGIG